VWEYILDPLIAALNFPHFDTPYCLVGHTHTPILFQLSGERGDTESLQPLYSERRELNGHRLIINPGSVGQPRDNDPRSAYAILDTDAATWEARRVAYPVEVTQAHMRAAQLPERLINRLAFGW